MTINEQLKKNLFQLESKIDNLQKTIIDLNAQFRQVSIELEFAKRFSYQNNNSTQELPIPNLNL